jgi:FkbM family methyltransferase
MKNIKVIIKKNIKIYDFLIKTRQTLRVFYNTKTRSRFLWTLRNGDEKISLNYPLDENAVIFDIGAYEGNFTKKIIEKYDCVVYAFEPLPEMYEYLKKKFIDNSKIKIFPFGLLDETKKANISSYDAGSSLFSRIEAAPKKQVELREFSKFVSDNNISNIDYVYMNIEGSEYKLLNHIIDTGNINKIQNLQIQFHNYLPNAKKERKKIRTNLKKTHICLFNYPFIWEGWQIKTQDSK